MTTADRCTGQGRVREKRIMPARSGIEFRLQVTVFCGAFASCPEGA